MNGGGVKLSLQLAVSDLFTTEAFYGGILELPVERAVTTPGAPEHLVIRLERVELFFVDEAAVSTAHPFLRELLESYPKGVGITIHIPVTNIEEIYEALMEEDLEILYPLAVKPYGVKEVWCLDPDGYVVVLEEPWRSR